MRIPQSAERLKEAPAQVLRAVLSKAASAREVPAPQALRGVLSKEAPAQALRAVFSSVGQVLLVTEKVRRRAMGGEQESPAPVVSTAQTGAAGGTAAAGAAPSAVQTAERQTAATPETAAAKPATVKTTADKPGTSKASTSKAATSKASPSKASPSKASTAKASPPKGSTPKGSAGKADAGKASASTPKPSTQKAETSKASTPKADTPPIPHYSELTIASLRARMRGLDAGQLSELISYERAHEDRETVIAMFERRIAKLKQQGPATTG